MLVTGLFHYDVHRVLIIFNVHVFAAVYALAVNRPVKLLVCFYIDLGRMKKGYI